AAAFRGGSAPRSSNGSRLAKPGLLSRAKGRLKRRLRIGCPTSFHAASLYANGVWAPQERLPAGIRFGQNPTSNIQHPVFYGATMSTASDCLLSFPKRSNAETAYR